MQIAHAALQQRAIANNRAATQRNTRIRRTHAFAITPHFVSASPQGVSGTTVVLHIPPSIPVS
ncbi:hypothetical protein PPGU19_095800 (plasmid) [Paraburkholderia sp. PGU19]|uniref:hypothetical protein n=1 Tax=Paraburkholderia sp. PGU19 TaxID=2735434 RepID=UPI0015DB3E0F|nr:hypothetical protein [Paraburkholderia sp. PGU19]BCG05012.1 hypothetical protein PPGU19_095800 [Paraburkholderia sp. PGU19]